MGVLGSTFAGAFLSTRGGSKEQQQKQQGPPVQAGSKDEEDFIQCVPFNPGQTAQMLMKTGNSCNQRTAATKKPSTKSDIRAAP